MIERASQLARPVGRADLHGLGRLQQGRREQDLHRPHAGEGAELVQLVVNRLLDTDLRAHLSSSTPRSPPTTEKSSSSSTIRTDQIGLEPDLRVSGAGHDAVAARVQGRWRNNSRRRAKNKRSRRVGAIRQQISVTKAEDAKEKERPVRQDGRPFAGSHATLPRRPRNAPSFRRNFTPSSNRSWRRRKPSSPNIPNPAFGELRQPAGRRHAGPRPVRHPGQLGGHPPLPVVPLRQLDVRRGGRALPDPRPVLHARHHRRLPLLHAWCPASATVLRLAGLQDRPAGRGRPADAGRLLGQRHDRGLRPHPRGARQEPAADAADDQRQRQPDAEPNAADVVRRSGWWCSCCTSSAARASTCSPS